MDYAKPIKICDENRAALEAALKAVNGKASTHTFTILEHLTDDDGPIDLAERRLDALNLPMRERAGAVFLAQSGRATLSAYNFTCQTTTIRILRRAADWYLLSATETKLYPRQRPHRLLTLTEAQDARIIELVRRAYVIARPAHVDPPLQDHRRPDADAIAATLRHAEAQP